MIQWTPRLAGSGAMFWPCSWTTRAARGGMGGSRRSGSSWGRSARLKNLGSPAAHVQADRGARRAGSQFDQVAYLVDHPQAVSSRVGRPPGTPGERVGDPALVPDLAEDLLAGVPDVDGAARTGVPQGVRGDLAGREHQVR